MDSLIYKINLDCLRKDSQAIVNAKIGEASGRKIVFTLYEGRAPFFVPSDTTVVFRAKKPSGAVLYNNCVVDDGKIEYTITSQTVAEKGVFPCEIQIIGADNKVIYTPCITLNVTENLYSDTEVESSNEFTELENALNKIPPLEVINSKYTKPDGGIPKTDLANDVQASLNKADTALQEHQSLAAYRTASEQDIIDSTKQDKLTAGDNITIAADGTISSTGGGAKAFFLNVFVITEAQVVTNKTYAEIKAAIDAGDIIYITDKNDVVYMPQVAETGSKIEFLWLDSHENRTYRWSAVVNSENVWSVTFPVLATTDEIGNLAALKTQAADNLVAAINEVKQTSDAKQDKLIAGENITIAADGKTISATGDGGSTVELDTTLSEAGKAADAKAVGDALAGKQDTISDLEAIRTGAAKGATALQSVPSTYRTALAQDVIDSGLGDRIEVIEGKEAGWNSKYVKPTSGIPKTDLANDVQASLGKADTALQTHQSLAAYRTALAQDVIDSDLSDRIEVIEGKEASWDAKSDFSGSYNDLTDKPTIPAEVTPLIGTIWTLTPTQVYDAVSAGIPVKVQYTDDTYGLLSFTAFNVAESLAIIVSQTIVYYNGVYILAELTGLESSDTWEFRTAMLAEKKDIPTVPSALKNPNALTIKIGSTTVTYDGSTAQVVTIDDGTGVSY